jgi:hypothetical protein
MVKFIDSPGSAYEVAIGIAAEEAAQQGLAVVEYSYSTNPPTPIFGRYKDAPKGAALGVTVDDTGGTKVVGGGGPAFAAASGQHGWPRGGDEPAQTGTRWVHVVLRKLQQQTARRVF